MKNQKRGRNVALAGAILQTVIALAMLVLWVWTDSRAALASLWLLAGGVPLWLVTAVLFHARHLEYVETLELQELAARGEQGAAGLFEEGGDLELRPAHRRVRFMQRWVVPIFTILFAGYHAALALLMLQFLRSAEPIATLSPGPAAVFAAILAVTAFLFSRYCTGMARVGEWRLLRPPGSYLLMVFIFCSAVFIALLFASQGNALVSPVVAFILPLIELLFAVELVLNVILDFYRPRQPGEEYQPSYDSRLFNIVAEPQRVGHSIADTLNYQFGFEVSGTWFYQLVSKAIVPMLVFAVVVMFALSCVVIVNDGETFVLKHWGEYAGQFKAGIHLKWPWPIDVVERFDTAAVHELVVGLGEQAQPKTTRWGNQLVLWTEEHGYRGMKEQDFLIATPARRRAREALEAPSVSIIKLVVLTKYRITDPYKFGYRTTDTPELLRSIVGQEMVQYCASATLDEVLPETDNDRPQAIMTQGRLEAAKVLKERLRRQVGPDGQDLGVEIVYVGIISAHPPSDAVPQFEKVLEAERQQDLQRYQAQGEASQTLAEVSGSPETALQLFLALRRGEIFGELQELSDRPAAFEKAVDEYIARARGEIYSIEQEIGREQLLGKQAEDLQDRLALQDGYEQFVSDLQQARENRQGYDYVARVAAAQNAARELFEVLEGEPAVMLAEARAKKWQIQLAAETDLLVYRRKLLPYLAAPQVYMYDQYMNVLDETLPGKRKYVLGVDPDRVETRLNLERQRDVMQGALEAVEEGND